MKHIVCKGSIYVEGKCGWFLDEENNQIYQIELETKKAHYIGCLAGHSYHAGNLIKKCGNEIYIFPGYCRKNIIVYNLVERNSKEIEIDFESENRYEILGVWETKDTLLAYSAGLHRMIEINKMEKKIVRYYDLPCNKLWVDGFIQNENDVHIIYRHDELIMVDYARGSIKCYSVRYIDSEVWGFTYDNEFLWINKKQGLYLYNMTTCKTEEYVELPSKLIKDNAGSIDLAAYTSENYVWFILLYSNKFMYLNKKSKEINFLTFDEEPENGKGRIRYFINFVYDNRYLYVYSQERYINFVVDMETALYWDIELGISDEEYQKSIIDWMQKDNYITEKTCADIHKVILQCTLRMEKQNHQENIGENIYHMI